MPPRSLDRTRKELSDFLRYHRGRLTPGDVGLPAAGRRRTHGLRREEVAALAGVGITWYTWFEQGREIRVSESFLLSVARALRLDDAECYHLFLLAQGRPPAPEGRRWSTVSALTQRIMDDLVLRPAYVTNLCWDVVAWNAAAERVFGFEDRPRGERNLLRMIFGDPSMRHRCPDWPKDARRMLAGFRRDLAVAPHERSMLDLIEDLEGRSPEFRRWWRGQDAEGCAHGIRTMEVAQVGSVTFDHETLVVDEHRHLRLVVYVAAANVGNGAAFEAALGARAGGPGGAADIRSVPGRFAAE